MTNNPWDGLRLKENERSKEWATRNRHPWTEEDDKVISEEWVAVDRVDRNERGISQRLQRTIESCRVRAERVRNGEERVRDDYAPKPEPRAAPEPCASCWCVHAGEECY